MRSGMKQILKAVMPRQLVTWLRDRKLAQRFSGLSRKEIFDQIYQEGYWGKDASGNPISGTGSHQDAVVQPYVKALREIFARGAAPTVVDLGCGDFNIGRQLVDCTAGYVACDISPTIIALNKERFAGANVTFQQLDLTEDTLPPADFCLVRQVLQHLSNNDISDFVARLNTQSPFRYLVVTEHVAMGAAHNPNVDKPSGPGIRVEMGSGIDLSEPPFCLSYLEKTELLSIRQDNQNVEARIVTTHYRLRD